MRRRTILLRVALIWPLVFSTAAASDSVPDGTRKEAAAPKNARVRVVLVTLDTLRRDHFDPDAQGQSHMPKCFARAQAGLRFSRFFVTSPATQPSHASMLTGLHPWEHGVTRNGQVLGEDIPSLAPLLKQNGFETRAVVASFPLSNRFGWKRGFDHFTQEFTSTLGRKGRWEERWKVPDGSFFSTGSFITDQALKALDAATEPKQFFWFHYFDPHAPYGSSLGKNFKAKDILLPERRGDVSEQVLLQRARDFYRADVGYLDVHLDRLLQRLEDDARDIPTHVFVVSDHGESFGEQGALGHGEMLTDEQLRVAAFLLSPKVSPGQREDVASGIDVARTLLSLAAVTVADEMGGRDLSSPITEPSQAFGMRRTFRGGKGRKRLLGGATREFEGELFFIAGPNGRIRRGSGRQVVPEDRRNLDPSQVRDLQQLFGSFESKMNRDGDEPALDPAVKRALEALGYVE